MAVEAVPAIGGSLGLMGILQVICTKCLTFLDTWETFCLIVFVHFMNSVLSSPPHSDFLWRNMLCLITSSFILYSTLMHCRQHSITVFRPQQKDLCLRLCASEGSIYHMHNYKCIKAPTYCVSLVRWSQLWHNLTCNPKQPLLRLIASIFSSLAPCPQNKRWPCLISEDCRLCHCQCQKQALFLREGFEEQSCLGKWKIQIN